MFLSMKKWFREKKKQQNKNKAEVEVGKEAIDHSESAKEEKKVEKKMEARDVSQTLKNKGKLFVGGLNYSTTSEGLKTYFSQFGKVIDSVVIKFPDTGKSRGFGFVTFAHEHNAECALRSDRHVLDGKCIDPRLFTPAPPASKIQKKKNKVFLGGLPFDISTEVIKEFFQRYGEISEVKIVVDKNTKKSKGFGFIWFKNEDAVEKCIAESFVYLWGKRVYIRRARFRSRSQVTNASEENGSDCHDEFLMEDSAFWAGDNISSVLDETSLSTSGEFRFIKPVID